MKSNFNKGRRELLKSAGTLVGATALVSGVGENAFAARVAAPLPQATGMGLHRFVIERDIHAAGALSAGELQAISQKSCGILNELGSQIQWVLRMNLAGAGGDRSDYCWLMGQHI